jgi:hypothetical protein
VHAGLPEAEGPGESAGVIYRTPFFLKTGALPKDFLALLAALSVAKNHCRWHHCLVFILSPVTNPAFLMLRFHPALKKNHSEPQASGFYNPSGPGPDKIMV